MSYVKNYDVGSIRLDAPRTDFIYELPLLSFGDVQHTIGLSLVFNSRFANSNPFYIANGCFCSSFGLNFVFVHLC